METILDLCTKLAALGNMSDARELQLAVSGHHSYFSRDLKTV